MLGETNLEMSTPFLLASPSLLESSRVEFSSSEGARTRPILIPPCSKNEFTGVKPIFKGRDQKGRGWVGWDRKKKLPRGFGPWGHHTMLILDGGGDRNLFSWLTQGRELLHTICQLSTFTEHGEDTLCEAGKERKEKAVWGQITEEFSTFASDTCC